ncbi:MAG TPA: hypothetical protein VN032_04755 [Thermoanaerobaculia bacterium]|nr:hypothetical protein [Thermoanaerobaculia bacterium]
MTPCQRPLDPIDAEAVAAGAEPVFAADAALHGAACAACAAKIDSARGLLEALDGLSGPSEGLSGLADRVTRLRPFSRRERRTYALWNAPVLLTAGLAGSGLALLTLPLLTAAEQVSLGAAASAPLIGLGRSGMRWASELLGLAPRGLEALSQGMRQEATLGLAAVALLVPLGLALSRVLARVPNRK